MRGGSGRLSAATTSQSSSKAGAMAEATMSPGMRSVSSILKEPKKSLGRTATEAIWDGIPMNGLT